MEPYSDPNVAGLGGSAEPLWEEGRPPLVPDRVRSDHRLQLPGPAGGRSPGAEPDGLQHVLPARGARCARWFPARLFMRRDGSLHPAAAAGSGQKPAVRPRGEGPPPRSGGPRTASVLWRCHFEGGAKAVVSKLVGAQAGLSSERRYTREVLPDAVWRGVGEFVYGRKFDGLARAAAIVAGLGTTTVGYLADRASVWRAAGKTRLVRGKSCRITCRIQCPHNGGHPMKGGSSTRRARPLARARSSAMSMRSPAG
jgi:hypothetical protein